MVDQIPSLPYAINWQRPVSKVVCGDLFAALLTPNGEVFTWGLNMFGQLGLKDSTIGVTFDPI